MGKVKEAIDRVNNDEYLRSALDYLEVHLRIGKEVLYSKKNVNCPNFSVIDWIQLPFYDMDFGWGKPLYTSPGAAVVEGKSYLFQDLRNKGSVLLAIALYKEHMRRFEKLLYAGFA